MFKAFLVAVVFAAAAEPAAYKVVLADPADGAGVTVKIDGKVVTPGKVYEVPPFTGKRTFAYEVTWRDAGETVRKTGTFEVEAGYLVTVTFPIPREFLVHRPPAD